MVKLEWWFTRKASNTLHISLVRGSKGLQQKWMQQWLWRQVYRWRHAVSIFASMFCDINIFWHTFCFFQIWVGLEKFGVDVKVLKDVGIRREFIGWTEEWGKELKTTNCVVVDVSSGFLIKYKNLSFEYDEGQIFTIYFGNFEFWRGKSGGWQLIGIYAEKDIEEKPCAFILTPYIENILNPVWGG